MSHSHPRLPVAFAVGGAITAILLWFLLGPLSLILDVVLGLWFASLSLGGELRENPLASLDRIWSYLRGVHTDALQSPAEATPAGTDATETTEGGLAGRAPTGSGPAPASSQPSVAAAVVQHRYARLLLAAAVAPVITGLLAASATGLNHSTLEDVCGAYESFVTTDQQSRDITAALSGTSSDDDWFDSANHFADVAADAGGLEDGTIAAAGTQLQTILKGRGSGFIVSVFPAAVYQAAGPIVTSCTGHD